MPEHVSTETQSLCHVQLTIEDIDIEEGNERETPLTGMCRDVPLLNSQDPFNRVERNHLLEELKRRVTRRGVREVGHTGRAGPGNDGNQEDTDNDGALDAVEHQHDSKDTAAEDANPHGWAPHLGASWANAIDLFRGNTTGQFEGG